MKKIFFLFAFSIFFAKAQSQLVTITDPNFLAWLQFTYPTCMSGNQMDITCSGITSTTTVDIPNLNIANIDGIEHFTSLQVLDCSNNNLTAIPALPQSLLRLLCNNNQISSIQMLPFSMVELNCNNNELSTVPDLPNTLEIFKCYDNNFTAMPTLPTLLQVLHCGGNPMTALPSLPQLLKDLDCQGLGLQSLPTLPFTLEKLSCAYNELTSLPTLPNTMIELQAFSNQINFLPNLPTSLEEMNVGSNNLTALPTLPASVTYLNCQQNEITSIPTFPGTIKYFYCRYNLLNTLPTVPNSMRILDCSYNPIRCLDFVAEWNHSEPAYLYFDNTEVICRPNYSLNLEPTSLEHYMDFPMCNANNPNGCGILAIHENLSAINVKIFPNPTSDFIQIESQVPLESIALYDMSGRNVMNATVNSTSSIIDISYLSNGFYTLRSGSYSTKLIKQ